VLNGYENVCRKHEGLRVLENNDETYSLKESINKIKEY
jgi:hypothetical protein